MVMCSGSILLRYARNQSPPYPASSSLPLRVAAALFRMDSPPEHRSSLLQNLTNKTTLVLNRRNYGAENAQLTWHNQTCYTSGVTQPKHVLVRYKLQVLNGTGTAVHQVWINDWNLAWISVNLKNNNKTLMGHCEKQKKMTITVVSKWHGKSNDDSRRWS